MEKQIGELEKNALDALREQKKKLSEQILEQAKALFGTATKELFARHPLLESFSWRQYTPYFNDGDECTFGVRNDEIPVTFGGEEFEDLSEWAFKPSSRQYHAKEQDTAGLKEAYADIRKVLDAFDEDDYKLMFGDHVKVTVTSPGAVEVDDYEHY